MDDNTYSKVDAFVQREVYACISDMAEYLFGWDDKKYASYDEWENMYEPHCPECGSAVDVSEDVEEIIKCPYCDCLLDADGMDMYPKEIYEYWLVSPYFGEKLRNKGEAVLERYGGWVWGRTCTGQAIALDGVVEDIVLRRDGECNGT